MDASDAASLAAEGQADPAFQPASYVFRVDSLDISKTRSVHEDTDHVAATVAAPGAEPVTTNLDLGDLNDGHYDVGLQVGPVRVDDPGASVPFNYIVMNSAAGPSEVYSAIRSASVDLVKMGGTALGGSVLGQVAGWLMGRFSGILPGGCDGPVAAEKGTFTGQELWDLTASGAGHFSTHHPGVDSPWGCGDNSDYTVQWSVLRQ